MNAPGAEAGANPAAPWAEAETAAALFAVDPAGTVGVRLRALPGPVRDAWLDRLRAMLPEGQAPRRIPLAIADDRLLGGLDLAATLAAGRPVAQRGLLAELDGGVALLAMAERIAPSMAARLGAMLDTGRVAVARDGVDTDQVARVGLVALDEGIAPDEAPPSGLCDRLAFSLDLASIDRRAVGDPLFSRADIQAARDLLPSVRTDPAIADALVEGALALGVGSLRAPLLALRVARAAAALDGRDAVNADDAAIAARLVLARRATRLPAPPPEPEPEPPPPEDQDQDNPPPEPESEQQEGPLADRVLDAVAATLPPDVLAQLRMAAGHRGAAQSTGRAGQIKLSLRHGRPIGSRRGELRGGARLHVIDTLKAAAPWQRLRRRTAAGAADRLEVRRDDFRIIRFKQRIGTTTIFVVDASGSAALQRLAEAKGAIELLLADCYVRRDKVALIAFRGEAAELLLPPTNSLVRAKRSLAGLPGGGGTPLASAIDAAAALAETISRAGQTPIVALLTDGRANIARDGKPGRMQAEQDALAAAGRLREAGLTSLLIDISPRPHQAARALAAAMDAQYLALPFANAALVSRAVQDVAGGRR